MRKLIFLLVLIVFGYLVYEAWDGIRLVPMKLAVAEATAEPTPKPLPTPVHKEEVEEKRVSEEVAAEGSVAEGEDVELEKVTEVETREEDRVPRLRPLRIGTWNLEFFGGRNDPERTKEDMQAIADFIKGLDVQVLGLNEVNGKKPLADLCRRLGGHWKYVVGNSGRLGKNNRIAPAILWDDSRVAMLGAGELSDLRRENAAEHMFHREPVTAAFRDRAGGPDFRVVVVHLKAGRQIKDFKKRSGELTALRGYLEKLVRRAGEDKDIVIIGDFNHAVHSEESQILAGGDFARYLTKDGEGRSIMHFGSQIDQIVPLETFTEIREDSFRIHNEKGMQNVEEWRRKYSDHFPVTVDLEAVLDDDPKAQFSRQGSSLN